MTIYETRLETPALQGDAELVTAALAGDEAAFGELVRRYQHRVYAIAWSQVRDEALAEDIVQEAFLLAYANLRRLRDGNRFGAWTGRIARNLAARAAKQSLRERQAMSEYRVTTRPQDEQTDMASSYNLNDAMDRLSPRYREAVILYYLEGQNIRECSQFLGMSETAFKTRLHRARAKMKKELLAQDLAPLRESGRSTTISAGVMGALPVTVMLKGGGGTGLLSPLFTMMGIQILPMWGLVWLSHRGEMKNFRTHQDVRRKVAGANAFMAFVVVMLAVFALISFGRSYGDKFFYGFMAVYMACLTPFAFWSYRLTRTRFILSLAIGNLIVAAAFGLVALSAIPRSGAMASFLIYNILLLWGNSSRPFRQDYNLFQRCRMGLLTQDHIDKPVAVSRDVLRGYSVFLGSRYLVGGRQFNEKEMILQLAPIKASPWSVLLPIPVQWQGMSQVTLGYDGRCSARISSRDLRALRSLFQDDIETEEMENAVERAVEVSLTAYMIGDEDNTIRALQGEPDNETFVKPPDRLRSNRWLFYISIGAGVFLMWIFIKEMLG